MQQNNYQFYLQLFPFCVYPQFLTLQSNYATAEKILFLVAAEKFLQI